MGIFYVYDIVADIVRRLYQPYERMSFIHQRFFLFCDKSRSLGYFSESLFFALEKTKFLSVKLFSVLCYGLTGIFSNTRQSCHGQLKSAFVLASLLVGKHTDGIGISFKIYEICPLFLGHQRF